MPLPCTVVRSFRRQRTAAIALACALLIAETAVGAQEPSPVGVVASRPSNDTVLLSSKPTHEARRRSLDAPLRIGAGLLGSGAGFLIGAVTGAGTASGCHGEYCELGSAVLGGAIGSVAIATLASAAPQLGSTCSADARVSHGVVGGITGALAGGVLGLVGGPVCILTYVAGAGIGAGWAASSCGGD